MGSTKIIPLDNGFQLRIKISSGNSNYNTGVTIMESVGVSWSALMGKVFKDGTSEAKIKQWAINSIETYYHYDILDAQ